MQSSSLFCLNGYPWQSDPCAYTIVRKRDNQLPITNDIFDITDMIPAIVKRMQSLPLEVDIWLAVRALWLYNCEERRN